MREFRRSVLANIDIGIEDVQEWWTRNAAVMRRHGEELLAETSGIIWAEEESCWWSEEIEKVVINREEERKRCEESQSREDRERFREKNKVVKKEVAQAKAKAYDDVYNELGIKKGSNKMIKLSKTRNKSTKDITHIKQIKYQDGVVLGKEEGIIKRWKEYFEQLLNEENYRLLREDGQVNIGLVIRFSRQEVINALRKMKNGKATGPDMIPVEAWKALGDEGVDLPYDLMMKIFEQKKVPNEWRGSILIPIFKGKGKETCIELEKAYNQVPRQEVWRSLRERRVPEKYVRLIQEMYRNVFTRVRSSAGETGGFEKMDKSRILTNLLNERNLMALIHPSIIDLECQCTGFSASVTFKRSPPGKGFPPGKGSTPGKGTPPGNAY
ncbi:uncharacterized protein [Palaemon carinicauda]|uniref:uncharacterized protein n=1 Tax=Palaemon carinicauda TaxID=392227 RepID=UPI0035B5F5EF